MTTSLILPARPDADHLRKQARQLLREVRAQQAEALQTLLAFHPRPADFSGLRDAQLTLARRYGFPDWEQLQREVDLRQLRHASVRERAERIIQHACLRYDGDDQPWRYARATEWLRQFPQITQDDFHCALVAADLEAVRHFLKKDPALSHRSGGPRNWPALMYVTYSRSEHSRAHGVALVRLLLEAGASPDSYSDTLGGFTALTGAIGEGERGPAACPPHPCADELVRVLLDAGANPNQSQALYNSMLGEHLGKWLPVFVQYGLKAGDRCNWSADDQEPIFDFLLCQVAVQGRLDLVRYLLEHGANPDAVSRYHHRSPLTMARLMGRTDLAELLEQFGATPQPLSIEDQFRVACGGHDRDRAASVLQQQPSLLRDPQLFRDCAMVDADTCLWLVGQGCDINTRDASGQTVLHNYARWNNPQAIATLLRHGADPDLKENNWQATALGMALHHQHWPVVEVLLPVANSLLDVCRVPDVDRARFLLSRDPTLIRQRTPSGHTALHLVSQARQDDPDIAACIATIELLLQHGADLKALNAEGSTAEQWHRQLGMDEVADYLSGRSGID